MTHWNKNTLPEKHKIVTVKIKGGLIDFATYDYEKDSWYLPDYDTYIEKYLVQGWTDEKGIADNSTVIVFWLVIAAIMAGLTLLNYYL